MSFFIHEFFSHETSWQEKMGKCEEKKESHKRKRITKPNCNIFYEKSNIMIYEKVMQISASTLALRIIQAFSACYTAPLIPFSFFMMTLYAFVTTFNDIHATTNIHSTIPKSRMAPFYTREDIKIRIFKRWLIDDETKHWKKLHSLTGVWLCDSEKDFSKTYFLRF